MSTHLLYRNSEGRTLPLPDARLYRRVPASAVHTPGAALLALGDPAGLTRWQRWWRGGPDRVHGIRRLLYLHRCAFEAELAGRLVSADFFWREAIAALRATWDAREAWSAVASQVGCPGPDAGDRLRGLVATELFMDSHIAFANGCLKATPVAAGHRAFAHAGFIGELLDLQPLEADFGTVLLPAVIAEVEALQASDIDAAVGRLRRERRTPVTPVLSDFLAALLFRRTIAALAKDPKGHERADSKRLERGIRDLEELRSTHAENLAVDDLLAQLYHILSVRLNNDGRVSPALLASAKAAAYRPGYEAAEEGMKQLVENMKHRQARAAELKAELRGSPNRQLNVDGAALVADADAGFAPMQKFQSSGESQRIAEARRLADAARLWRELDGGTGTRPANDQLTRLREVVIALRDEPDANEVSLTAAFAATPNLPKLDARAAARLVLALRGQPVAADDAKPRPEPLAIDPASAGSERGERLERVGHWLFGRQDASTKAFVACASAILAVTLVASAIELPRQYVREGALAQIRAADPSKDYERVIAASVRFLGAKGIFGSDPRRDEVLDAYARAFTAWFANVDAPDAQATQQRVAQYRALTRVGDQR
jgi:hypothetical protein